jgi:hypothetical protein
MNMSFGGRKQRAGVIAAAVWGAFLAAPGAQMAQTMGGGAVSAAPRRADDETRAAMLAQRPYVEAAVVLQREVDQRGYAGFTGIVLESDHVAMWWKDGRIPVAMAGVLAEARKIARVRIGRARYSLAELKAAAAQIQEQTPPGVPLQAIKFSPTGEGLILSTPPTADPLGGAALLKQSLPDVGVPTSIVTEEPWKPISRDNDQSPWSGGATIINSTRGAGCTSGFGVQRGSSFFVLTAAHCGQVGDRFNDGSGEFIGNMGPRNSQLDQALLPVGRSGNRMYVGNRQSNTTRLVTGWEPCFVGEMLCQSGVTSARAVGGPVCNLRVRFVQSSSLVEAENLSGQVGARPGDSGGPVYGERGSSVVAKGTNTYVAGNRLGFHDMTNANRVFGVNIAGGGGGGGGNGVVFFQHVNFAGASSQALARGSYTLSRLQELGLQNDWASSVQIPSGFTVTMFQHDNFTGTSWTLTSNTANFTTLSPNANDQASSVRIQ